MAKYVVIGASAAGVGCATKLRDLDKTAEILMISADARLPCNRCLLSEILSGEKTEKDITVKDLEFFRHQNITVMLNTVVNDILPLEKKVILENSLLLGPNKLNQPARGELVEPSPVGRRAEFQGIFNGQAIEYDKLFLGIGKSGFIPKIPGSELNGVFSFYGLPDVQAIMQFVSGLPAIATSNASATVGSMDKVNSITIVGAGLTGLECADALAQKGFTVTVVDKAPHVLPNQIDQAGAEFIQNLMSKSGVIFYPGQTVEQISGQGGCVSGIKLSGVGENKTDAVIFAIGGRTNTKLAADAGIDVSPNGIVTKNTMQTSNPDIFAGGDCCAVTDLISGQKVQSCLWPDAVMQGMVAAHGMVGVEKTYPGTLVITSSNILGVQFVTCGPVNQPNPNFEEIIKTGPDFYHKFLLHDGILKGFVMVGKVENVGILRKKMIEKTPFNS